MLYGPTFYLSGNHTNRVLSFLQPPYLIKRPVALGIKLAPIPITPTPQSTALYQEWQYLIQPSDITPGPSPGQVLSSAASQKEQDRLRCSLEYHILSLKCLGLSPSFFSSSICLLMCTMGRQQVRLKYLDPCHPPCYCKNLVSEPANGRPLSCVSTFHINI